MIIGKLSELGGFNVSFYVGSLAVDRVAILLHNQPLTFMIEARNRGILTMMNHSFTDLGRPRAWEVKGHLHSNSNPLLEHLSSLFQPLLLRRSLQLDQGAVLSRASTNLSHENRYRPLHSQSSHSIQRHQWPPSGNIIRGQGKGKDVSTDSIVSFPRFSAVRSVLQPQDLHTKTIETWHSVNVRGIFVTNSFASRDRSVANYKSGDGERHPGLAAPIFCKKCRT